MKERSISFETKISAIKNHGLFSTLNFLSNSMMSFNNLLHHRKQFEVTRCYGMNFLACQKNYCCKLEEPQNPAIVVLELKKPVCRYMDLKALERFGQVQMLKGNSDPQ